MERIRISKKEWKSCAGPAVRLPCQPIESLSNALKSAESGGNSRYNLDQIRQDIDRVMWGCPAVQKWNHLKSRQNEGLSCDNLRNEIIHRLK